MIECREELELIMIDKKHAIGVGMNQASALSLFYMIIVVFVAEF